MASDLSAQPQSALQEPATLTFEQRDAFNRKPVALKAISLLRGQIDVSPMVIDGNWGIGKTEFCYKLINEMKNEDTHHLIYVDAFKSDHASEPLLTVLSEILKIVPDDTKREGFIKKSIPAMRFGIKTALKAGAGHILRQDVADIAEDFEKEIKDTTNKIIDSTVESILKDHMNADKNLETLRGVLKEIAQEKPIVIFIDELDRCRPTFAIDVLEVIKHTFNVKGVQFVLVTNTDQLKASINHCYGDQVLAQQYLDKFIKFRFTIPYQIDRNSRYFSSAPHTYLINLIKNSDTLPSELGNSGPFYEFMLSVLKTNKVSLREVETLFRHLEIYQLISNNGFYAGEYLAYRSIKFLAVFVFCFKSKMATDIEFDQISILSITDVLGLTEIPRIDVRRPTVSEVILVLLSRDSAIGSMNFNEHLDDKKNWDQFLNQRFSDGMDIDECSNLMKDVIKDLSLSGN